MNDRRLYIDEVLLLLAVALPLAVAESLYWLLGLAVVCSIAGWRITIRRRRSLLTPLTSRLAVIAAFIVLVFEYFLSDVQVLSLGHFMQVVCMTKLLHQRTLRDHIQSLVLLLLLLAITAIVSGSLLFPLTLAVFLTSGIDALIRLHLESEAARVTAGGSSAAASRQGNVPAFAQTAAPPSGPPEGGSPRLIGSAACFGLAVGALIFLFCPRWSSPLSMRMDALAHAGTITGFGEDLSFDTLGPIGESDRPVMRVRIEVGGTPLPEAPVGPYLRGSANSYYHYSDRRGGRTWEWRRFAPGRALRKFLEVTGEGGDYAILSGDSAESDHPRLAQKYWMESGELSSLFAIYPAVSYRLGSHSGAPATKWIEDQSLPVPRLAGQISHYSVLSLLSPAEAAETLENERDSEGIPRPGVAAPNNLPRQADFIGLVRELRAGLGPLTDPKACRTYAQRIVDFLRAPPFAYTLNPPRSAGYEPIGEFLFRYRRGHCVYFASAMTLLCQLGGVPARVVSGYCGGEYNSVGQFYLIRQKHAHSWVEVFVPGQDWVTFDPTPSATAQVGRVSMAWQYVQKYVDFFQFHWANLVVSYNVDQRRTVFENFAGWLMRPIQNENTFIGAAAAFVRELFGWRLNLTSRERLIYWVFALLVLALGVLTGYILIAVGRRFLRYLHLRMHDSQRIGPPEAEFYYRFIRQLRSWGIQRRKDQTPAELAAGLAGQWPVLADAPELVRAYYDVVFGHRALSPSRRGRIELFLRQLAALDTLSAK